MSATRTSMVMVMTGAGAGPGVVTTIMLARAISLGTRHPAPYRKDGAFQVEPQPQRTYKMAYEIEATYIDKYGNTQDAGDTHLGLYYGRKFATEDEAMSAVADLELDKPEISYAIVVV